MKEGAAVAIGVLTVPVIPAVALAVLPPVQGEPITALTVVGWTVFFYPYAFLATLLFALPAALLMRRFNRVRWWTAAGVGFLIGVVIAIAITWGVVGQIRNVIRLILLMGSTGAISGFVFWLIWRQGTRSGAQV